MREMTSNDVTCPECLASPGIPCRAWKTGLVGIGGNVDRSSAHTERAELARQWCRLLELSGQLGLKGEPDLHEVEFLSHFGSSPRERRTARELLALAEQLGYTAPGDSEAA